VYLRVFCFSCDFPAFVTTPFECNGGHFIWPVKLITLTLTADL
jgi:hypothetical protein